MAKSLVLVILFLVLFGATLLLGACQHPPTQCAVPLATATRPSVAPPADADKHNLTAQEILDVVKNKLYAMQTAAENGDREKIMTAAKQAIYALQKAQEFGLEHDNQDMADTALEGILKIQACIIENRDLPFCKSSSKAPSAPTKPPTTPNTKTLLLEG